MSNTRRNHSLCFRFALLLASILPSLVMAGTPAEKKADHRNQFASPIVDNKTVFEEKDGLLVIEAEHFSKQTETDKRAWYLTTQEEVPTVTPDGDPTHIAGASGGAYLELLPDTRRTHDDKLIEGENFSPQPGKLAVLTYKAFFNTPGTYWIWIRAFTTTTEDNGLHIGIDGEWPESAQRWQTVTRGRWHWESRQRTKEVHVGVPGILTLEVKKRGPHEIHLAMREDGIEIDRLLLVNRKDYQPQDLGPESCVRRKGKLPSTFKYIPPSETPPQAKLEATESKKVANTDPIDRDARAVPAASFNYQGQGYYLEKGQRLSIDPKKNSQAKASIAFPFPSGRFHTTLKSVGEEDGASTYTLIINGSPIATHSCPLARQAFDDSPTYWLTWKDVPIDSGDIIEVQSITQSKDGQEYSRGRWSELVFAPSDAATRIALQAVPSSQFPSPSQPSDVASQPAASQGSPSQIPKSAGPARVEPRSSDGNGMVRITGDLRQWHKATLTLDGPFADERDLEPNPFTDYRLEVSWTHESGAPTYVVPGYFAADGNAGESGATRGVKWRCHFVPDRIGRWTYTVHMTQGKLAALEGVGVLIKPYDGHVGRILVEPSTKTGRDFRAHGRLQYVGKRYLQFAGTQAYFLKFGADSPETLLAYEDFDNTLAGKADKAPLKNWQPHIADWQPKDPTWKDGKGKGLIGALNYLADQHVNAISFLTYNAGGDGDNVWPFVAREEKLHYDCSKLDQWGIVFDHATHRGLYLHFKMQENEIDDNRRGDQRLIGQTIQESLDGGQLGVERKLYCRELIARFGHALALNWNIGEENTQSTEEVRDMVAYLHNTDPYHHPIVLHTFPGQQEKIYQPLLGQASLLSGVSLQNPWDKVHALTLNWIRASEAAGRPWVVANDEQNSAATGVPADPGYEGSQGTAEMNGKTYSLHDVRKATLWGNLMAGGAGVEYYFGYKLPQNDLVLQDFRSRHLSWSYGKHALDFFDRHRLPIVEMVSSDALVGADETSNQRYCFAKQGEIYVVFLANGGSTTLDLSQAPARTFDVRWYNPRKGGELQSGKITHVNGGSKVELGHPPADPSEDWVVLIR